ncbi:hypothetical protein J5N97_001601 [Dioscorea zingiberensis]|uniref:RING-type domain-containing protein n=1 Tax=Dioscorea zingiberensis TaxID=325984 RepID=A0A9D5H275_9LILI|nr:hypothetical protein J5N97_001601 [Dioscorea zingiberensis]
MNQARGATPESIDALPRYKFKSKKGHTGEENDINSESIGEGGILAAGTDKERIISAEDAVCCICLAKYVDNDELRELPCTHFFHLDCVDKWLKINASCPLCKFEVGRVLGVQLLVLTLVVGMMSGGWEVAGTFRKHTKYTSASDRKDFLISEGWGMADGPGVRGICLQAAIIYMHFAFVSDAICFLSSPLFREEVKVKATFCHRLRMLLYPDD